MLVQQVQVHGLGKGRCAWLPYAGAPAALHVVDAGHAAPCGGQPAGEEVVLEVAVEQKAGRHAGHT
jgi:hypothetical protein